MFSRIHSACSASPRMTLTLALHAAPLTRQQFPFGPPDRLFACSGLMAASLLLHAPAAAAVEAARSQVRPLPSVRQPLHMATTGVRIACCNRNKWSDAHRGRGCDRCPATCRLPSLAV